MVTIHNSLWWVCLSPTDGNYSILLVPCLKLEGTIAFFSTGYRVGSSILTSVLTKRGLSGIRTNVVINQS